MTTFITGATTSLGRVLVREFVQQGEAVRLLDQPNSNRAGLELPGVAFIRGDVTDSVAVRKAVAGCDRVCHLTVLPDGANESLLWRIQREGTRNVLQAALDLRANSIVHISSPTVLGPTAAAGFSDAAVERPTDGQADASGDAPPDVSSAKPASAKPGAADEALRGGTPPTLWAKAQLAADEIVQEYALRGAPAKIVYPGLGYGYVRPPGDSGLAEHTLLRLAAGKSTLLPATRHHLAVTYFKDIAQGISLAHTYGRAGEAYLLVGDAITWAHLWATVAEVVGKPGPQRATPLWWARLTQALPPDLLELAGYDWNFHSQKARQDLGWQPTPLATALAETFEEAQVLGMGAHPRRTAARAGRRA
jgi:dihydroflavonol-4-reductase